MEYDYQNRWCLPDRKRIENFLSASHHHKQLMAPFSKPANIKNILKKINIIYDVSPNNKS